MRIVILPQDPLVRGLWRYVRSFDPGISDVLCKRVYVEKLAGRLRVGEALEPRGHRL